MANRTYNASNVPGFNAPLSSATIRNEFTAIEDGFTKVETELDGMLGVSTPATLSSKNISLGSNTITGTRAQFNDALLDGTFVTTDDATAASTPSKIVQRDASGNFSAGTISANLTGAVTGNVTGNVTGDVTGDLTGSVTGNLTGDVTGNLTGNVTGSASGSSGAVKSTDTTGTVSFTGPAADTNRTVTVPDANVTMLYAGGALGTPSSGDLANCTFPVALGVPAGTVVPYAGRTAPSGWLECNGDRVAIAEHANLAAALYVGDANNADADLVHGYKTTTGTGAETRSTTGTFIKIPDLRGEFIRGHAGARAVDTGRKMGSAQADDYKAHSHSVSKGAVGGTEGLAVGNYYPYGAETTTGTSPVTGGTETRPRNIAMMYIIKY